MISKKGIQSGSPKFILEKAFVFNGLNLKNKPYQMTILEGNLLLVSDQTQI